MEQNLGRTCLILALFGLLLAVAYAVSPSVGSRGTVATHAGLLHGGTHADDDAEGSDDDQKKEQCEPDEPRQPLKHEFALLLTEHAQPPEGKNFAASNESIVAKPQE